MRQWKEVHVLSLGRRCFRILYEVKLISKLTEMFSIEGQIVFLLANFSLHDDFNQEKIMMKTLISTFMACRVLFSSITAGWCNFSL